jgi:hypothetical protein
MSAQLQLTRITFQMPMSVRRGAHHQSQTRAVRDLRPPRLLGRAWTSEEGSVTDGQRRCESVGTGDSHLFPDQHPSDDFLGHALDLDRPLPRARRHTAWTTLTGFA